MHTCKYFFISFVFYLVFQIVIAPAGGHDGMGCRIGFAGTASAGQKPLSAGILSQSDPGSAISLGDMIRMLKLISGEHLTDASFPTQLDWDRDGSITLSDVLLLMRYIDTLSQPAVPGNYTVLAWNDLGMHCVDGNDYSIFSILPPFNNLHAQLVKKGAGLQSSGVTVTFESVRNLNGAWNTTSTPKTNFWDYAESLYGFLYGGGSLQPDKGITGIFTPNHLGQKLSQDTTNHWWAADGIPILPYNDDGSKSYYQLVRVRAMDAATGSMLANATAVLPVSDEMDCRKCHGSDSGYAAAQPAAGWVGDADPEKDYKLNILRLHDQIQTTGLFSQAESGTPVLCAGCHLSNALPGSGTQGVSPLTSAIHARHAQVIDPLTGQTLNAGTNRNACYSCHPGQLTKCLRGAMGGIGNINCQDCHGTMSDVGADGRQGWLDEPTCQQCHQNGQRYTSVFTEPGVLRPVTDRSFATTADAPLPGKELYRYSTGHHGVKCEGCHGAPHAVYPSADPEDNLLAMDIQGHDGTIAECTACHTLTPQTSDGGPHGLHSVGQSWVGGHGEIAEHSGTSACAKCHGSTLHGSALSATFAERSFSTEWGVRQFTAGQPVSCYDCHNGPGGD